MVRGGDRMLFFFRSWANEKAAATVHLCSSSRTRHRALSAPWLASEEKKKKKTWRGEEKRERRRRKEEVFFFFGVLSRAENVNSFFLRRGRKN